MTDPGKDPSPGIVVVGAGGLGGYLGGVLHRGGARVHLVARGEHLDAIVGTGMTVVDGGGEAVCRVSASTTLPEIFPGDIAFVTVKAHGLDGVLPLLRDAGDAGAWIVPLVNGVEAATRLARGGVSPTQTVLGVAYLTAFRTAPGRVERQGKHGRILVGYCTDEGRDARPASALEALSPIPRILAGASIEMLETEEIETESWRKMLVVTALAGACASEGMTIGRVLETPAGRALVRGLVAEAAAVGRALGRRIPDDVERAAYERVCAFPHDFRPSLIHDLERGVPTEVEALNGAIGRMGRSVGVATPLHDGAVQAIRAANSDSRPL